MKVLILNEFDDKTPFIRELSENLLPEGFDIDILDLKKHRLISYRSADYSFSINETVSKAFLRRIIKPRVVNVFFKLIYYNWFYQLPKYTHVSYHYVGSIYLFFHRKFTKNGKIKSSAILWGSDFYRTTSLDRKIKQLLFQRVDFLGIGNPIMKMDFLRQNPGLGDKVKKVVFGIKKLSNISEIKSSTSLDRIKSKWRIPDDSLIVTIGYNGRREQQHLRVLEGLSSQFKDLAEKLHLIIPFGYLGDEAYKNELKEMLEKLNMNYTIVDWFGSDDEVAEYRIISDIAINAQTTDAMAASVQEHFFSGSVLLTGNWLPYGYFRELGLLFDEFEWSHLSQKFLAIVKDLEEKKKRVEGNKDIIWSHSAWPATIQGWKKLYSGEPD